MPHSNTSVFVFKVVASQQKNVKISYQIRIPYIEDNIKYNLKENGVTVYTRFIWLKVGFIGSCEYGNEP
jgi:hypothetical protein